MDNSPYDPKDGLVVCRCEEVPLTAIREAMRLGASSVNEIKMWTRAGMGMCQGRMCLGSVRALLMSPVVAPVMAPDDVASRARWPSRPVALGALDHPLPERPAVQLGLLEIDLDGEAEE